MAKYNLNNDFKAEMAKEYFNRLIEKKAWIELREMRLPRSIDANALYWLWLTAISTETQIDKNELHFLYRATFLRKSDETILQYLRPELWKKAKMVISDFKWFPEMNVIIDIISYSTTVLDTAKFSAYLKEIQKHARVYHNVILLNLKDKEFADFYKEYGFN